VRVGGRGAAPRVKSGRLGWSGSKGRAQGSCSEGTPQKAAKLLELTKKEGLLVGKGGRWGNVLRIAPPMLISDSELDDGMRMLERAFAALE
jgi:4-aminobutyrate aminotransferase-like enzyme